MSLLSTGNLVEVPDPTMQCGITMQVRKQKGPEKVSMSWTFPWPGHLLKHSIQAFGFIGSLWICLGK